MRAKAKRHVHAAMRHVHAAMHCTPWFIQPVCHARMHHATPMPASTTWGPLPHDIMAAIGYERFRNMKTFKLDNIIPYSAGQDPNALAQAATQALQSISNYRHIVVTRAQWAEPQRQGDAPSRLFVHVTNEKDVECMKWLMEPNRLAYNQRISEELGPVELAIFRITLREMREWQYMYPQHAHTKHMDRCAVINTADGVMQNFSSAAVAAGLAALAKVRQARPVKPMAATVVPVTAATKK